MLLNLKKKIFFFDEISATRQIEFLRKVSSFIRLVTSFSCGVTWWYCPSIGRKKDLLPGVVVYTDKSVDDITRLVCEGSKGKVSTIWHFLNKGYKYPRRKKDPNFQVRYFLTRFPSDRWTARTRGIYFEPTAYETRRSVFIGHYRFVKTRIVDGRWLFKSAATKVTLWINPFRMCNGYVISSKTPNKKLAELWW